jgi:dipeptidyl aminopeptidase/acylaminoacyl peptidase
MRRGRALVGAAVLPLALIAVAPALFQPTGHRLAMTEKPSDYGLPDEPVTFRPRDRPITLRAWWIPADHARAALVFVHGGGDDNRNLPYGSGLALARDLAADGYALLMIDLRNFGESEGTPEGITFGDLEVHDVMGAVDYLAAHAPALPVGAIGFSMGGATVLRAAARDPRLRAVVADSAFADARTVAAAFTSAATGLPRLVAVPFVWSAQHLHGVPLARGDTLEALRGATMPPVLLIHDEHDPIASVADCRRLAVAIPTATMWITDLRNPGPFGTHIQAYRLAPAAYVERVTAFLNRVLTRGGAAPPNAG